MTREEAIEQLEPLAEYFDAHVPAMGGDAIRMAVSALRAQQETQSNDPLTLEKLREMDGEVTA